ncbi:MAG: 6,7-dimethyl-8-ribityllumazine synthase [Planctomycetia bacterium]|nr:6,7-dimethyl-8-ribityllumazine synthase [Planctomycetia bacterium]
MIYEGNPKGSLPGRVAIIVAKFNQTITNRLLRGALDAFRAAGVSDDVVDVFYVPGAFEIPTVSGLLVQRSEYCGILALGAVIKGETSHDEHINRAISLMFAKQGAEFGKPVMFGVLTCNSVEQALARSAVESEDADETRDKAKKAHLGNKGADCAQALLEMVDLLSLCAKS